MSSAERVQVAHGVGEWHLARQHAARVGSSQLLVGDHRRRNATADRAREDGRRCRRPRCMPATTSPPSNDAAAFSACPSTLVAIASGSLAPAAAAAASASAADEPSPLDSGIEEFTCIVKLWCPSTLLATTAPRWRSSSNIPAPKPSLVMAKTSDELEAHLDVEIQRHGEHVEARTEVGGTGGNAREHCFSVGVATTSVGKPIAAATRR